MRIQYRLLAGRLALTLAVALLVACSAGKSRPPTQATVVAPPPAAGSVPMGTIGVVSVNEKPMIHANEIQHGNSPIRAEEAVGFVGVGLGAGLAALAACAPALFLAPLCGILAASAGVSGAALGGMAGDVASDIGDAKKLSSQVGAGTEMQQELRLRVIDKLREAGYVTLDLGESSNPTLPAGHVPELVIETTLREVSARGAGRGNFTVRLLSYARVIPGHQLSKQRPDEDNAGAAIPTRSGRDRPFRYIYASPALPLGASPEQTGRALLTAVSAGIVDTAGRLAHEDFERFRARPAAR